MTEPTISQTVGKVINRVSEIYFGEGNRPQEMAFPIRYLSSLFGCAVFFAVLLGDVTQQNLRTNMDSLKSSITETLRLINVLRDPIESGQIGPAHRADIDSLNAHLGKLRNWVSSSFDFVYGGSILILLALPATISLSIKRGGPLRFFFLGVAVPSLAFSILRASGVLG